MRHPRLPYPLRPLFALVRETVPACDLTVIPVHYPSVREAGRRLAGQCDNAAAMFKHLAGDAEGGWRTMNIPADVWAYGSHWFLLHVPTGTVVDPTYDQFPPDVRIPYEIARGRTSGGVRYAVDAKGRRVRLPGRVAVRVVLASRSTDEQRRLRAASTMASRWAMENAP
jgi:hypothetical protein